MTDEDKSLHLADQSRQTDQAIAPDSEPPDEEWTPFIDKLIAFVILAIPFSAILVWAYDGLIEMFSKSVANIMLLIGIVTFLLSISAIARRIYQFRTRPRQ